ncbi:hypothetical protein F4824DRAFT_301843 [Ustulina deusta]|nr:hypothetical protein F4824DRAFT_301843 [Ustulina deusta]
MPRKWERSTFGPGPVCWRCSCDAPESVLFSAFDASFADTVSVVDCFTSFVAAALWPWSVVRLLVLGIVVMCFRNSLCLVAVVLSNDSLIGYLIGSSNT